MRIATALVISVCALLSPLPAAAQVTTYPVKPVRMLVPFPPGGGTDYTARLVSQKLAELWGQQVVVENRPGASTTIASDMVAKAAPDGYTLIMASVNHSINPSLYAKLPYDTLRDFAPVSVAVTAAYVLVVHPSLPARSVKELIAIARARPGEIQYASSGSSGPQHLAGELFRMMAGVDMVHVPYKGGAPAAIDVVGGHVPVMFGTTVSSMAHVKTGRLRALAVTSAQRLPALPELPTIAEAGVPGYEAVTWWGVMAPARTPREIIVKLHGDIVRVLQQQDTRNRLATEGVNPEGNTPEQFAAMIRDEIPKMARIVKQANIRID